MKLQEKSEPTLWQKIWKEFLEPLLFAVLVTQFLLTIVGVDGHSMMPNLRHGERVFVPKYETWLHKAGIGSFKRGDIVIFKPPRSAADKSPSLMRSAFGLWNYRPFLIKRVIAVGGDKVSIDKGEVLVNDKQLDSSWTTKYWDTQGCWDTQSILANGAASSREGILTDKKEITVPDGHYFVMGDNRTEGGSEDSRMFGTVPLRDIAGRAAAIIWPIMRKTEMAYDCPSSQPKDPSGENQMNWRLLNSPKQFNEVTAPR